MNDTKSYILQTRENLAKRLAGRFIAYLILFALSCGGAFAFASLYDCGGYFLAVSPVERGGFLRTVLSVIRCTLPSAVCLLAVYAAAHTIVSQAVSGAILVWRGLCLGCAGGLMGRGAVYSIDSSWSLALTLYFLASVVMMLLAAYSYIYSLCLCRAHSDGTAHIRREVAAEYLRLFLFLSGAVFAAGGAAVFLI